MGQFILAQELPTSFIPFKAERVGGVVIRNGGGGGKNRLYFFIYYTTPINPKAKMLGH